MNEEPLADLADEDQAVEEVAGEQAADEQLQEAGDPQAAGDPQETGDPQEPAPSMDELVAQRDGYLNDLQRVTAEFANYRRKAAERQQETVAMAAADIVEKVLPVLDACDAAVAQGAEDVIPIRDSLFGALEKEGLAKLDDPGATFDPTCHEAVAHEPGEGEAVIAEVLRAGYVWNSRVLRPAMVKVRG
ncbi:MAG: nucleotide exchange factor GrpE [Acidimicrobiia bacterium]|nr:nucleotide exchange factor GrpE [Acidimicrobiia bacterium]MYE72679.1 nucleotide exchange factor GrpE [Acidimicrobiia bacterium]MYJ61556.1 nucleotide exchange factor GrpE [Acidimicrobiia bacterium]